MKIGTYNLHYGGDGRDLRHWSLLLDDHGLDVLLVQESFTPARYGRLAEPIALWSPVEGQAWGSGLYYRGPVEKNLHLRGFTGWVTGALLDFEAGGPHAVFSVHIPTWPHRSYTTLVHQVLDELADLRLGVPVVLGGDFNLLSAGERRESEPLKTTPGERQVLCRLEEEFDLVSCWIRANPDVALQQTLRWTGNRKVPYHCDALFVPSRWVVHSCQVLSGPVWDRLSDHNPVIADVLPNRPAHAVEAGG